MPNLSKIVASGVLKVAEVAPRFMARRLAPRLLRPKRKSHEMAATYQRVDVGNGICAWREPEADDGKPLVLLVHGFDGRHDQWQAVEYVVREAGYRVAFLDPPGHGFSEGTQCDPVIFGKAIAATIAVIGPVSLFVGHSMGAVVGVLAAEKATPASAYVLFSSPMVMANTISQNAARSGVGPRATAALQDEVGRLVGVHPSQVDAGEVAAKLTAPALLLHDAGDRQVDVSETEKLADRWPGAELIKTNGLGHNRILSDRDVLEKVALFISRLPACREPVG